MSDQFYISEKHQLPMFETKEHAKSVISQVPTHLFEYKVSKPKMYSNANTPIFVISKSDDIWHVIIGEKIGWIVVRDWMNLKSLDETK